MVIQSPNDLITPAVVLAIVFLPLAIIALVMVIREFNDDDGRISRSTTVMSVLFFIVGAITLTVWITGVVWDQSLDKTTTCSPDKNGVYQCTTVYTDSGIVVR